MSKGKSLPCREGDWFAVPLSDGSFAVGLVARMATRGGVLLGYFFGPRLPGVPALHELEVYRPHHAVLVAQFGDLGLIEGRWPVIGELEGWDRTLWPMPDFGRDEAGIREVYWRVRYTDDDPTGDSVETRITKEEYEQLPNDSMSGHLALEEELSDLLGASQHAAPPSDVPPATESAGVFAMSVTHFLYFPSEAAAKRAAERIAAGGSSVTVRESEPDWLVLVHQMIPPTEDALDETEAQLGEVATAEGGEYDGWERETQLYPMADA